MNVDFKLNRHLNDFLEMCALNGIKGFYPSAFSKESNISLVEAFELLLSRLSSGEIFLVWEIRCPNEDCRYKIMEYVNDKQDIDYLMCDKCGTEIENEAVEYFPRFDLTDEYKQYIKEEARNNQKKNQFITV